MTSGMFTLGWLKLEESLFLHELDAFKDYISKSDKSIKEVQSTFEKVWDEEVSESPEAKDELYVYYEDEISKTFKVIPHIAFSSLYISLSSLFESSMKKACGTIAHPTLTWKDMAGNDFERLRAFLSKVAEIDLSPIEKYWQKVMVYYKLRNRIVHHGSQVELDSDRNIKDKVLANLFDQYPTSLSLQNSGDFLVKGIAILLEYMNVIQEVIVGLYILLGERLKRLHSVT